MYLQIKPATKACDILCDAFIRPPCRTCAHRLPLRRRNKVIVVDDDEVETGSFNFTEVAEKNKAENVLEIRNIFGGHANSSQQHDRGNGLFGNDAPL